MVEIPLLTGKIAKLGFTEPTGDEKSLFTESFEDKLKNLKKIDPEIALAWEEDKDFMLYALGVSKYYFDCPYGGPMASSGQFADLFLSPQLMCTEMTTKLSRWQQSITRGSWQNLFGSSTDKVKSRTTTNQKTLFAISKLVSYRGDPGLLKLRWTINDFTYPLNVVEPYLKFEKAEKLARVIDLPGKILIQPGGTFYTRCLLEGSGTATVEIAPFPALCFAMYDEVAQEITY